MNVSLIFKKLLTRYIRSSDATRSSGFQTSEHTSIILTQAAVIAIKTCVGIYLDVAVCSGHCNNCDGKPIPFFVFVFVVVLFTRLTSVHRLSSKLQSTRDLVPTRTVLPLSLSAQCLWHSTL